MGYKPLTIQQYATQIELYDVFVPALMQGRNKEQLVDGLLTELNQPTERMYAEKRRLLHAILNTLAPNTLKPEAVQKLDNLLQLELKEKNITHAKEIISMAGNGIVNTKVAVWQGDITTLKTDAIVNAANSQMLGCFQPLHACIDNAIHTAAGVQLRDDCEIIMRLQGFTEPTGTAKITRGYNLPARFVLHTVGPIVQGWVTEQSEARLASSYNSCLEICKEMEEIRSIAFCGISTGVFGYPAEQAAQVAVITVRDWLNKNPGSLDLVVFDVFSDKDRMIYTNLLKEL